MRGVILTWTYYSVKAKMNVSEDSPAITLWNFEAPYTVRLRDENGNKTEGRKELILNEDTYKES